MERKGICKCLAGAAYAVRRTLVTAWCISGVLQGLSIPWNVACLNLQTLQVVREIMESPKLPALLQDPYGNYVVQSSLQISTGALHQELVEQIRPYLPSLRGTPHGKRILAKLNGKI
mmetsp:Transcript_21814/g.52129  ORF Transcript_21814/g.52129 Transcript_21814/m.52129 type:complete len:117 (+) Transcript_21814:123-473(+)